MSKNSGGPYASAAFMVVDSYFIDDGVTKSIAESRAELPDLNWEATLARAIAEGALEEWVKAHPGVDLPDVI